MITITPYRISNQKPNKRMAETSFLGKNKFQTFSQNVFSPKNSLQTTNLPWVKDTVINKSFDELESLKFSDNDIKYIQAMGIILPFKSGHDVLNFIKTSNTRIKFDTLSSPHIHAQYDYETNFIKINEIYKNTQNPAEILAIASAIIHEAGHAKDKDGDSSIQEELDCLALNAISHRAFVRKYPNVFQSSDALIIKDGTSLYAELFFDKDSSKNALIKRVKQKYGFLPVGSFTHPPSTLAFKIKNANVN